MILFTFYKNCLLQIFYKLLLYLQEGETEDDEGNRSEKRYYKNCHHIFYSNISFHICYSECFFAVKDTVLGLALKDVPAKTNERRPSTDSAKSTNSTQSNNSDIQQHLQSMIDLLYPEETLKMVKYSTSTYRSIINKKIFFFFI